MNKFFLFAALNMLLSKADGQQKVIPAWKPGDAWKIRTSASTPSESKQMDENGQFLSDVLYQEYIWKVEEETEDGYVMSLQMTGYTLISATEEEEEFTKEMSELYAGLKDIAPIRYLVKKEGIIKMQEQSKPMEDEPALTSVMRMSKAKPAFLNDSIIEKYVDDWVAARNARTNSVLDSMEAAGEPMPELVEIIDLSKPEEVVTDYPYEETGKKNKKKGKGKVVEEDEWDYEEEEWEDDEDWSDTWRIDELYINALKETFTKRVEMLHTPFGTEIKQIGEAYTVEDFTEQELAQLELTPDVMKMLKITGTYQFVEQEGILEFSSDIFMDMQEFMRMMIKGFEDIFSEGEEGGKKKKKKGKNNESTEIMPKASDKIPSMDMRMKSVWNLQSQTFIPANYSILVATSVEEEGVKLSFEAKEMIIFEKIE